MRPLIGITCSRLVGGAWGLYSPGSFMDYTYEEYSRAVLACGGAPILIPIAQEEDSIEAILDHAAGLILSGGPDLHPRCYGELPQPHLGDVDEALDRTELAVARAALRRDLPLLGICRGIQVLNVSLGGTLYQDIPSQVPNAINHYQSADKRSTSHWVEVPPATALAKMVGAGQVWVNSKHHQAVKDPAPGVEVCARAPDGLIEAIQDPRRRFALGVQWHPEGTWTTDPAARGLFQALVVAAGR